MGTNIVRFHQLDAEWHTPNIFSFTKGKRNVGGHLDPEAMERLDYLIYCLKEEGIYVYFDNGSEMEICDTEEGFVWVELYCANGEDYSFLLGKDVRFSYIDGITSVKGGAVANEPWTEKE